MCIVADIGIGAVVEHPLNPVGVEIFAELKEGHLDVARVYARCDKTVSDLALASPSASPNASSPSHCRS